MPSVCSVCGTTDFYIVDGCYYCGNCNSQSQVEREVNMEETTMFDSLDAVVATRMKKTKASDEIRKKGSKSQYQPSEEQKKALAAVEDIDYPRFLGRAGLRLATFTEILFHFTTILIRDFDVDHSVRNHALNILQRYLSHMKVAFCDEEVDESNPYCPHVSNELFEQQLKAKQKDLNVQKEGHLQMGENIVSFVASKELDENLTAHTSREEAIQHGDIHLIEQVKTKISAEAYHRLLIIPLSRDVLLVISYLACLCAGANWIMLSDITRWYREGRLPISFAQRNALLPVKVNDANDTCHCGVPLVTEPIVCLSEAMRFVLAVCQMTQIPERPISIDFHQLVYRFCHNLNLPSVFAERVQALIVHVKPNIDLSEQSVVRFGRFNSSILLNSSGTGSLFSIHKGFECDKEKKWTTHDAGECNVYQSVIPTPEVKAIALILFALKLMFGLDDRREYDMTSPSFSGEARQMDEVFDFSLWLHQLRMRMDVWRGRALKNVLEKKTRITVSCDRERELRRFRWTTKSGDNRKVFQYLGNPAAPLNVAFKDCVPNYIVKESKEFAFYTTFADDIEPRPAEQLHKEALLAPLRYQAIANQKLHEELMAEQTGDIVSEELSAIDRYDANVFLKSFTTSSMNYKPAEECTNHHSQRKMKEGAHGESQGQTRRWRDLFPCSSDYIGYPRPLYSKYLLKWQKPGSTKYEPLIYSKAVDILMRTASRAFSDTFKLLLKTFAVIIGEEEKILYTFVVMIEMMFTNLKTIESLKESIKSSEEIVTSAQRSSMASRPRRFSVILRPRNADSESTECRFEILTIKELDQLVTDQEGTFPPDEQYRKQHNSSKLRRFDDLEFEFETAFALASLKCW